MDKTLTCVMAHDPGRRTMSAAGSRTLRLSVTSNVQTPVSSMPPRRDRYKERIKQAEEIVRNGLIASIPCSYCLSHNQDCLRDEKSRNCSACTRRGQRCERRLHSGKEWHDIRRKEEKTAFDIEKAQNQYREYSQKMREILARLEQLRIRQKLLRERDDQMLDHDQEVLGLELTDYKDSMNADGSLVSGWLTEDPGFTRASSSSDASLGSPMNWLDLTPFLGTADLLVGDSSL